MLKRIRLAALDLDGTLVDSASDLTHCLGDALDSVGLGRPSLAEAKGWIGDGVEALIRRAIESALGGRSADPALIPEALAAFDRCYGENLYRESRLYPGVAETLIALASAGIALGCVTNKRERYARELLRRAGIEGSLSFIFGGDTFSARKPDPLPLTRAAERCAAVPGEAIMVGDSINDRRAARGAGFGFVFAAYGYARADDPALTDGLAVIQTFADLLPLLCASRLAQ